MGSGFRKGRGVSLAVDPVRVAGIRNRLETGDRDALVGYGREAETDLLNSVRHCAQSLRDDFDDRIREGMERLRHAHRQVDPSLLAPSPGLLGGLVSDRARLRRLRDVFDEVRAPAQKALADIQTAGDSLTRRFERLDASHDQLRALMREVDAHLEAAGARFKDLSGDAALALGARLKALMAARERGLDLLAVIRAVQNYETRLGLDLKAVSGPLRDWERAFADGLGMSLDPRVPFTPDRSALDEARTRALDALDSISQALSRAARRGLDVLERFDAAEARAHRVMVEPWVSEAVQPTRSETAPSNAES